MDAHAPLLRATQRTKVVFFLLFLLETLVGQNEEAGSKRRGGAMEVAAGRKSSLAALKRPGDKGSIKKTTSGKFQPQLFIKELNTQRALGSYETVEEAAAVLATANDIR